MFDGIEMHVVNAAFEIQFITTCVFKEASLPYRMLIAFSTAIRLLPLSGGRYLFQIRASEGRFDLTPTRGVVRVAAREFPYCAQMVR